MKLLGLIAAFFGVTVCVVSANTESPVYGHQELHRQLFRQYAEKYNKVYAPHEINIRFGAFLQNLERVQTHNQEAAEGKHSFTLAMNHLADLTDDEYKMMLGYKRSTTKPRVQASYELKASRFSSEPASWDWREHNVVAPVKNQGQCGSCWAFSAIASMEGLLAKETGKIVELSEQELVDCVKGGVDDCQHGGEMQEGFEEIITHHGGKIDTEDQYKYTAESEGKCLADDSKAVGKFSGYANVTTGNEQALLTAAYQRPVVAVAIDASSFMFQLYHSGVFDYSMCKNDIDGLDHGVAVVGYGSDGGSDYWIVRNSWGDSWGQSGYIWMSRNKNNQCGIATDASFPLWGSKTSV